MTSDMFSRLSEASQTGPAGRADVAFRAAGQEEPALAACLEAKFPAHGLAASVITPGAPACAGPLFELPRLAARAGSDVQRLYLLPEPALADDETFGRNAALDRAAGTDVVLIADDNAALRTKIIDFLDMEGIHTVQAETDETAIAEAERVYPAVVLLDIKMPGMDGLTAAEKLVEMPWRPKVILMSGFDDSVRLANRADLPIFAFLKKPVPLKLLTRFVWDALDKSASHRSD